MCRCITTGVVSARLCVLLCSWGGLGGTTVCSSSPVLVSWLSSPPFFLTFGTPPLRPLLHDLTGTPGGYIASGSKRKSATPVTPGTDKKSKKPNTEVETEDNWMDEIIKKMADKTKNDNDSDSDNDSEIPDPSPQPPPKNENDDEEPPKEQPKKVKKPKQSWQAFRMQTFERYVHVAGAFKRIRGTVTASAGAGNPGPGGPRLKIDYSEMVRSGSIYASHVIEDEKILKSLSLHQVMSATQFQQYQKENIFYDTYGAVFAIYGAVHTPIEDGKFKKDYIVQFTNYPGVPILVDGLTDGFFVQLEEPSTDRDSDFEKHFGYEPIVLPKVDVNATENHLNNVELTLEINKKCIKDFINRASFQIAGVGNPEKTKDIVFSYKVYQHQANFDPRRLNVEYKFLTVSQETFKSFMENCKSYTVRAKMVDQLKTLKNKMNNMYHTEDSMWYFCEESVNKIMDDDEYEDNKVVELDCEEDE